MDRDIQNWKYYNKEHMLLVWIDLLTSASYEDNYYDGRLIKKGQCIIGLNKMSTKLGISVQQLRTCLGRLKSANQITSETTNKYTVITIINWCEYQDKPTYTNNQINTDINKPITNQQQTNNNPVTTTKEVLEVLEVKESFLSNELPFPDVQKMLDAKEQEQADIDSTNLFDLLEQEFGRPISQREVMLLGEWQSTYEHRLIYYAIREAVMYENLSFDYIDAILIKWKSNGYTFSDIEDGKQKRKGRLTC